MASFIASFIACALPMIGQQAHAGAHMWANPTAAVHKKMRQTLKKRAASLGQARQTKAKTHQGATLEIALGKKGHIRNLAVVVPSPNAWMNDEAQHAVIAAEPFAIPSPTPSVCVIHIHPPKPSAKKAGKAVVACAQHAADFLRKPQVAGLPNPSQKTTKHPSDPGYAWLQALNFQSQNKAAPAIKKFQYAHTQAPQWPQAKLTFGMALATQKHLAQAVPLLEGFLAHMKPDPAIVRLARQTQEIKARVAQASKPRPRLSKEDVQKGVHRNFHSFEPCLAQARADQMLKPKQDTLVLTWTIAKDGSVPAARLEGPQNLRMTRHGDCIERALRSWTFAPYTDGSEVTVTRFPFKVAGTPIELIARVKAQKEAEAQKRAAIDAEILAEEASAEPTFSVCNRTQDAIGGYLQRHLNKITACVQALPPQTSLPNRLGISFVVAPQGTISELEIDHRHYREGPFFTCFSKALLAPGMAKASGAACPTTFHINLAELRE